MIHYILNDMECLWIPSKQVDTSILPLFCTNTFNIISYKKNNQEEYLTKNLLDCFFIN